MPIDLPKIAIRGHQKKNKEPQFICVSFIVAGRVRRFFLRGQGKKAWLLLRQVGFRVRKVIKQIQVFRAKLLKANQIFRQVERFVIFVQRNPKKIDFGRVKRLKFNKFKCFEKRFNRFFQFKNYIKTKLFSPKRSWAYTHSLALAVGGVMFIAGTYFGIAHYLLPKIRALTESTHYMPYDGAFADDSTAFNRTGSSGLAGYDDDSGAIVASSSEVKLGAADDWWSTSWEYKKRLTVTNLSNEPTPTLAPTPAEGEDPVAAKLAAGQQMSLTVNTAQLVTAGKLQADCDDLRVVYSTDGMTFREIARSISTEGSATDCSDSSATHVTFPLQASLDDAASSSNYYLFYGNDGAEAHSMPKEKYLSFDGVDDYVEIPHSESLEPSEITINVHFRLNDFVWDSGSRTYLFSKNNHGYTDGFYGLELTSQGSVCALINIGGDSVNKYTACSGSDFLSTDQWYSISFSYDGSLLKLYSGYELLASTEVNLVRTTGTGVMNIGDRIDGDYLFEGDIDSLKIWDSALSVVDIQKLTTTNLNFNSEYWSNLVAYYQFNEGFGQTVTDSSFNSNTGTLGATDSAGDDDPTWVDNGNSAYDITRDDGTKVDATLVCPFNGTTTCLDGETPTTETGAIRYSGEKGSALSFDGVDDQVVLADKDSLDLTNLISTSAWVYLDKYSSEGFILSKGYRYAIDQQSNGRLRFLMSTNGGWSIWQTDSSALDLNTWHHVVLTYNSNSDPTFYVDGVEEAASWTSGQRSEMLVNDQDLLIGGEGSHNWSGAIDELSLWEKKLSSTEVENLYSFGIASLDSLQEDLVFSYHFDENGSDPRQPDLALDASGNGNHGTINGSKYVSGLVGSDGANPPNSAHVGASTFGSHQGIFIEEGTTNKVTNPSFEHSTWDTNWGLDYFNYDNTADTFTPKMAKRNSAGPFAAGLMVQGDPDDNDILINDTITFERDVQIFDNFYKHLDPNQFSIVFWWTPEYGSADLSNEDSPIIFLDSGLRLRYDYANDRFIGFIGGKYGYFSQEIVAGQTYLIVLRVDTKNTLDGSHYISLTVDESHNYRATDKPVEINSDLTMNIGRQGGTTTAGSHGIIEGLTIYRRPLYTDPDDTPDSGDETGIDIGNGDELEQIYNAGVGQDPTLITGSWDVVFALPTNAQTGELTSGEGEAWTHPHASNVLYTDSTNTGGFMMNGDYSADGWAMELSPSSVTALSDSEKIYSGGYKITSANSANEGIKQTLTNLTSGQDYVIRAVANSGDGVGQPKIFIYDETNDHDITEYTGTVTSTRTGPDNMIFTFELPTVARYNPEGSKSDGSYDWVDADTTSITIKLVNAQDSGEVHFHQVELYENLVDNPSFEIGSGDPWIPVGWGNSGLEAGYTEVETANFNSGSSSVKYNTQAVAGDALGHGSSEVPVGEFFMHGGWYHGDGDSSFGINTPSAYSPPQYCSTCRYLNPPELEQWNHFAGIRRVRTSGAAVRIEAGNGASGDRFIDDMYFVHLTPVSLTVTSADETNSTEATGLRVDGADTLTQPITNLSADRGVIKFQFTPRHDFTVADSFGSSDPHPYVFEANYDHVNFIRLLKESANSFLLRGTFDGTEVFTRWTDDSLVAFDPNTDLQAGETYDLEIRYQSGGNLSLYVDGTKVATSDGVVDFANVPNTAYFGSDSSGINQYDGTFSNFESLTPTENTDAAYSKFADSSAQLVNAGSVADQYTITLDPDSTATHTLSAYVYNGTDGSIGGTVDNSVAELYYNGATVTTEYEDTGGGWWRLTGQVTPIDANREYGLEVKAGKSVYVDGVQLEAKEYATTYVDGSLGEGYSWDGAENESESSRIRGILQYSLDSTGVSASGGSLSFWMKPKYINTHLGSWQVSSRYIGGGIGSNVNVYRKNGVVYGEFGISNYGISLGPMDTINRWYFVTATWNGEKGSFYADSEFKGDFTKYDLSPDYLRVGSAINESSDATISDLRIFDSALTDSEIQDLYYQGLSTHSTSTEQTDRYQQAATYTSPVIDLNANGGWGNTPVTFTDTADSETVGTINYFTRTSTDNNTWTDWTAIDGNTINSDARPYLQWKADFDSSASSQAQSPSITNMTLNYVEDTTAPDNPDVTALGYSTAATASANLTSGEWHNFATPKFTWDPAVDEAATGQSSSGINGYHVLLTTDDTATPTDHTGADCYTWAPDNEEDGGEITIGTDPASCELSDNIYYLRVQTKDKAGNIADPVTLFTYKYDGTIPGVPASVSSTTVGYSANNSFDFYWPPAVDTGGSGIAYYEYKTGSTDSEDPFSSWQATTGPDDRVANTVTAYSEGQNLFYVRTIDQAGNYSATTSNVAASPFYFNESAPTEPTNLQITPSTSEDDPATSNVFTVTWEEPDSFSGDIEKYYYCVNCTPSATTMTETTASQTVSLALQDTALATQQGKNTLYLVAEDNNINGETGHGNRNFEAHATIDFYASTTAPTAPANLSISDSSDRTNETWRLTLAWNEAAEEDGVDHYNVYRSTDGGDNYTNIGNVSSEAYTDTNLTFEQTYHYKVTAIDNAGSESLASNVVSESPVGKFTNPPSAGGTPSAAIGSSTATITWSTSREAYGTVEYGKSTDYGSSAAESTAVSSHSVKLTGLAPGQTYHYRVHSLDESSLVGYDRSLAYSDDYTFTTLTQADISNVQITDIGLDSAVVTWDTSSLASSQVDYGLTTEYGETVQVSTTPDESTHTARLANLEHSTKYHFRIQGITADATDIASEDYSFGTITFPEITATLLNTDQEATGATVVLAWATNVPTTGTVEYQQVGLDTAALDQNSEFLIDTPDGKFANLSKLQDLSQAELAELPVIPQGEGDSLYQGESKDKHVQRISGLEDGSIYVFTIRGKDQYGNETISDPIRYVTGIDTRAPRVLNQIIETPIKGVGTEAKSQIIVSFETDEPAYSQVLWGQGSGTEYPQASEKSPEPTTKHVVVLRDLEPTTTYHLRIEAEDQASNKVETEDTIVVTPTAQQAAFDIVLKNLEDVFGFLRL